MVRGVPGEALHVGAAVPDGVLLGKKPVVALVAAGPDEFVFPDGREDFGEVFFLADQVERRPGLVREDQLSADGALHVLRF